MASVSIYTQEQSTLGTVLEFVECDSETMFCGTRLCPEGAACFNITDFDSSDTFPADTVAIVTIENAADALRGTESIVFLASNSTIQGILNDQYL